MRADVRLAGSGGQGLVTAGVILAEAAGLHDGRFVAQTQSYGPEARGGASRAEVVISDRPIHYPKAQRLDVLLAMTQEACDRYFHDLKPEGILIVDAAGVPNPPTSSALVVPIARLAAEELGSSVFASVAALGVLAGAAGTVSAAALEAAVLARVPAGTEEANRKALAIGIRAGEAARAARPEEFTADA